MPDISAEVSQLQKAVLGEEVRDAFVSCMTKINSDNEKYQGIKISVDASAKTVSDQVKSIDTKKAEVETSLKNIKDKISESVAANTILGNTIKTANDVKSILDVATATSNAAKDKLQEVINSATDVNSIIGASVANANNAANLANQAAEKIRDDCYPMLFRDFDGKDYSTFFMDPEDSIVSTGTKQDDNASLATPIPSTNTQRNPNMYDVIPLFKTYECNGYVDTAGEPHITAIKGEPGFKDDGSNGDVCVAFKTGYIRRIIDTVGGAGSVLGSKGEKVTVTDTWRESEYVNFPFLPYAGAIRPDGTVRPYILIPKYQAVTYNGMYYSLPGFYPVYNVSHNNQIAAFKKRGPQYCGETTKDSQVWETLFEIVFATMNSQNVMRGCTDYGAQYKAAVAETSVERIVVTNSQGAYFLVGSCVSIGDPVGNTSIDRSYAYMNNIADRVKVTRIEKLPDGVNTAVYVDNKGSKFDITATTYITTMPWHTGSTDKVIGTCGSPTDAQSGKEPFKFLNLELAIGQYIVKSDIILNGVYDSANDKYEQQVCIAYDSEKFAASVTANYLKTEFTVLDTNNNLAYIRTLGFDKKNPSVRMATEYTGANSGNRYGDAVCIGSRASGTRGFSSLGYLNSRLIAGLRFADLSASLAGGGWVVSARPSCTGKCGTVADWAVRQGVNLTA